jgi:hypothetical protein
MIHEGDRCIVVCEGIKARAFHGLLESGRSASGFVECSFGALEAV